jgi:nucleoside-diphosphate-sugar epimerase
MRILIIGASKGIGLETTRQSLAAGYDVRALARSASSLDFQDARLEKVRGDALNQHDVEAAIAGVDAVIVTLGVGLGELVKPVHLFSDATRVLIAAMKDQGVNRLQALVCSNVFRFRSFLAAPMTTKAVRKG